MKRSYLPFLVIMGAVLGWGAFHAVGTYLNYDAGQVLGLRTEVRGIVVVLFVVLFLAFWGILLAGRQRRLARSSRASDGDVR
jgi:hypothetical protein